MMARPPWEEEGKRLKLLREALGLSQVALCAMTGITPSAWNNAETGDNRIGLNNALKLCQTFGASLDWIYRAKMDGLSASLISAIKKRLKEEREAKRA